MVVKKIKNPKRSATKRTRIEALANYIRTPESSNANEKCVYENTRGFLSDTHNGHKTEMLALAEEAVRSKDPISHYVLSWHEDERPDIAQIEHAVSLFLDELGLVEHQVIYGLHADTDNLHLHVMVNRVHPETLKVVEINKGFDLEAAHRAIARIEAAQGWRREKHGRYQVEANGSLVRAQHSHQAPQPAQSKRDHEYRTGEKSAERIAMEEAAPLIQQAQTWAELHRELAAKGMRYAKVGSGAKVWVGDIALKASSVSRAASLGKLEKRLGIYQPAAEVMPVIVRQPEPLSAEYSPQWHTYRATRQAHHAAKTAALLALQTRQAKERATLAAQQYQQREEVLSGDWQGRGTLLNALRSVLAEQQHAETNVLYQRQRAERSALRKQYPPFLEWREYQRLEQMPVVKNKDLLQATF